MITALRFGPWLPDVIDHENPGLEDVLNAIPGPEGYKAFLGLGAASGDLGAPALSAQMFERADGTRVVVCATAGDLHTIIGGTVTNSGLSLSLTAGVAFERFGSAVYATNKSGTWYLANIESSTAFVAAGWTIPNGLAMARIGDFMFMGNLLDTDASDQPYRIRWSPFNNPQGAWATDVALQSDAVDMPQHLGRVQAVTGGASGLVFQRKGISRVFYTGTAAVFAKEVIEEQRGCPAPLSVVNAGESVYFLSDDGFAVTEGTSSRPISTGRVWQWFLDNSDQAYLGNVVGAIDWPNRCVVWTVIGNAGAIAGLLLYNWETEWWGRAEIVVDTVFSSGQAGLTLEQVSALYPDIDAMTISLDSPEFAPRGRVLAAFDGGEYKTFSGSALGASFETGEFQPVPGRRTFVRSVTPIITNDAESTLITLRGRDRQNQTYSAAPDVALGPLGFAPFGFDARFFRCGVSIPAGDAWSDAYGLQIEHDASGRQ